MNALQSFDFETHAVRVVMREDDPWFVGSDICRALNHSNSRVALERLEADEKGVSTVYTPGGPQEMTIVSEAGVYRLIFTSRVEAAERFKRWLAHDVLPSLRKFGTFTMLAQDEELLPNLSSGTLWGQPVAKINAAARLIGVANRIYGPDAARVLRRREKGLPKLDRYSIEAMAGRADDDEFGCWNHLMRAAAGSNRTIGQMFDLAIHDDLAANALGEYGIAMRVREAPECIGIANSHPFLADVFQGTQWHKDWRVAFAKLPGSRPSRGMLVFGRRSGRAVLISKVNAIKMRNPMRH